jgi:hypothetical protein
MPTSPAKKEQNSPVQIVLGKPVLVAQCPKGTLSLEFLGCGEWPAQPARRDQPAYRARVPAHPSRIAL